MKQSISQSIEDFVHTEEFPDTLKQYSTQIIDKLNTLKVLDPACGSGAFPIGMLQKLIALKLQLSPLERGQRGVSVYDLKLQTILNSIYGCDIQPMAVELSRLRCWLSLIIDEDVDKKKDNWGIANLPNLDFKFVCVNTLIGLPKMVEDSLGTSADDFEKLKQLREEFFTASAKRKLQIEKEFKTLQGSIAEKQREWSTKNTEAVTMLINWTPFKVEKTDWFDPFWMFGIKEGFDSVIGNPPYVRADRDAKHLDFRKKIMDSKQYKTLWEKWDLYVAFIERGFNLLSKKGILEFIIPDAYMSSKYAEMSHDYFLNNAVISRINFCSDIKIFEQAVRNIIIEFKKEINPNHIPLRIKHIGKWENFILLSSKKQSEMGRNSFKLDSENKTFGDLSNTLTWGEICYVSYGLRPSSDERYWKGEFKKEELISDIKDNIHSRAYIEGKWITKYTIEKIKYLEWGTERSPNKFVRPTFPELYVPEKIIKGRMTDAIYDNTGLLCNDSCFVSVFWKDLKGVKNRSIEGSIKKDFKVKTVYPLRTHLEKNSEQFNLKYLLAILNSKFAYKFLDSVRRSQIGFYPDDLKKLPIKKNPISYQQKFIELVDEIIIAKQKNPQADTKHLEDQIDIMVYKLYELTYEEVKVIDPEIQKIISKEEYGKFEIK